MTEDTLSKREIVKRMVTSPQAPGTIDPTMRVNLGNSAGGPPLGPMYTPLAEEDLDSVGDSLLDPDFDTALLEEDVSAFSDAPSFVSPPGFGQPADYMPSAPPGQPVVAPPAYTPIARAQPPVAEPTPEVPPTASLYESGAQDYTPTVGRTSDVEQMAASIAEEKDFGLKQISIAIAILALVLFVIIGGILLIRSKLDERKQKTEDNAASNSVSQSEPQEQEPSPEKPSEEIKPPPSSTVNPDGEVTTAPNPIINSEVLFSADLYSDTMDITKHIELRDSTAMCYFSGVPELFKREVIVYVTAEQYNKYDNGDAINLRYNVAKFEGALHAINIKVKE